MWVLFILFFFVDGLGVIGVLAVTTKNARRQPGRSVVFFVALERCL